MKQSKLIYRLMPALLAFCFFAGSIAPYSAMTASANEYGSNYTNFSNEEKQAYLEQQLKEVNKKLDDLASKSKDTEEYINALDEKISYMNNQLEISKEQIKSSKSKIETLKKQYSENEETIAVLEAETKQLAKQIEVLSGRFALTCEQYAQRARAMYVSGNTTILEAILTSDDISTLLTRLEMIRRVSKQDKKLLETLRTQGEELNENQLQQLNKKDSLINHQESLVVTQQMLSDTVKILEKQQSELQTKQQTYEKEKQQADAILAKIQDDTKNYSEFRHQTQEDIEEINKEIEAAGQKYIEQLEQQNKTTTTTTTTTTAATTTTQAPAQNPTDGKTEKPAATTAKPTITTTQNDPNRLNMTYPVPSFTRITTAYGSAGYAGHTGVDFACASGSKVVAVESGVVVKSTDIKSHANCSCGYTGGGYHSYGRYILILHDKKDASGNYVFTLYAHNSQRIVAENQRVEKGQLIAYSGSTGNSSGPHCHFEVRTPSSAYADCVNPTRYLP